jgi:hypothetical protein
MITMLPHRNIHKHVQTFPAGKTHNQIDHYLMVANVRERLVVSKQVALTFDVERFYLKNLSDL